MPIVAIELTEKNDGKLPEVRVRGMLTHEDYQRSEPELMAGIRDHCLFLMLRIDRSIAIGSGRANTNPILLISGLRTHYNTWSIIIYRLPG